MSDGPDFHVWIVLLKSSAQRLADPPEAQIAYLRDQHDVGDMTDELALEFDSALRPMVRLLKEIPEARALLSALLRVDSALEDLDVEWRASELKSSPGWAEIRRLASAALDEDWPD